MSAHITRDKRNARTNLACSVDGFIAHTDGSHDGFSQDHAYWSDIFTRFPETVPSHLRDATGVCMDR